jgi:hypothetical protein
MLGQFKAIDSTTFKMIMEHWDAISSVWQKPTAHHQQHLIQEELG